MNLRQRLFNKLEISPPVWASQIQVSQIECRHLYLYLPNPACTNPTPSCSSLYFSWVAAIHLLLPKPRTWKSRLALSASPSSLSIQKLYLLYLLNVMSHMWKTHCRPTIPCGLDDCHSHPSVPHPCQLAPFTSNHLSHKLLRERHDRFEFWTLPLTSTFILRLNPKPLCKTLKAPWNPTAVLVPSLVTSQTSYGFINKITGWMVFFFLLVFTVY